MCLLQCFPEEPSEGSRILLERKQKGDCLPGSIHCTVHPFPLHSDIGFADPPRAVRHTTLRTDALIELRCISLDPPEQGGVIDLNASIGEHALKIAVADGEL